MENLYRRIKKIMEQVEYLQKDDNVDNRYKAISEEKVTSTIRKAMIENGVVIIPVEQSYEVKENGVSKSGAINLLTMTNTKYRIQNVDDKDDYIIAASSGSGVDTQDKGIGKAMTYSYKYLLLRTFAIPTGEDPDKISSEELDKKLQPKTEKATSTQINPLWFEAQSYGIDLDKVAIYYKKKTIEEVSDEDIKKAIEMKIKGGK
jgi:hypothetical protein